MSITGQIRKSFLVDLEASIAGLLVAPLVLFLIAALYSGDADLFGRLPWHQKQPLCCASLLIGAMVVLTAGMVMVGAISALRRLLNRLPTLLVSVLLVLLVVLTVWILLELTKSEQKSPNVQYWKVVFG